MGRIRFGVNPNEGFGRFVERTYRAARQRLNAVTDLAQRQGRERRGAGRGQLGQNAGVDARSTVSSCTHECGQRLAEAIGHFLGNVLDGGVDRGSEGQRTEVRVILNCFGRLRHRRGTLHVTVQHRLYHRLTFSKPARASFLFVIK